MLRKASAPLPPHHEPCCCAQVVAGALLAVGIVNCGVLDEVDPALALLSGGFDQL